MEQAELKAQQPGAGLSPKNLHSAILLTTRAALTSNHCSIAWAKRRLVLVLTPCLPRGTGRSLLSWPAPKQVPEVSLLPLPTKGLLRDPHVCVSGLTRAWSQGCGYFGRVPPFPNASETSEVPLQQVSIRGGGRQTAS